MSATLPATLAVGDDITAAFLDNFAALMALVAEPVFFQATYSTTQSLTNNTPTALSLDTETIDIYTGHGSTSPIYTIPAALNGYRINVKGVGSFAANATGIRNVSIWQNGSTVTMGQNTIAGASTNSLVLQVNASFVVATGDTIQIAADQTSGGALNTVAGQSGMVLSFGGLA